ncbi:folylpolyglutamate synthase [Irineochytrium annulatum]|nr:folylpolyglutamate synthase [Irineochytrium annulatum]
MTIELGLAKITALLRALGDPQDSYDCIHVAGTNGKGSVCTFIASVLNASSIKVGRFSSPHLITPRDCITVDGQMIPEPDYADLRRDVEGASKAGGIEASSFEILTAVALMHFRGAGVEVAVVEVGMGGRLDATNVFKAPAVCVITCLALDHVEFLGSTIEAIAGEKAGIVKPGAAVVVGRQSVVGAMEALRAILGGKEGMTVPPVFAGAAEEVEPASGLGAGSRLVSFELNGREITCSTSMHGDYQLENLDTAMKAVQAFVQARPAFTVTEDMVRAGVAGARWPGRLEWLSLKSNADVLVDGAHNPQGVEVLGRYVDKYVRTSGRRVCWILAFKSGKPLTDMLRPLLRNNDKVCAVGFSLPEEMPWIQPFPPADISGYIKENHPGVEAVSKPDLKSGLAAMESEGDKTTLVICGSLYLIADLYRSGLLAD